MLNRCLVALAVSIITSGCATLQMRWAGAEATNTKESYGVYVARYPGDSVTVREAKRRIEDPDYAFFITCRLGTLPAFLGYARSHASADFGPLARARVAWMTETRPGDLASHGRFISDNPGNPFSLQSRATFPILWLGGHKERVGIAVGIDSFVERNGILGRHQSKKELRDAIASKLLGELTRTGVTCVRLDTGLFQMGDIWMGWAASLHVSVVVALRYGEAKRAYTRNTGYRPLAPGESYLSRTLHRGAMEGLVSSLFGAPTTRLGRFTIVDSTGHRFYYRDVSNLASGVGPHDMIEALCRFSADTLMLPVLLVAANDADTAVRRRAFDALTAAGGESVTYLARMLKSAPSDVRLAAAGAMGSQKDVRAVEPLITALRDEDAAVRAAAMTSLKSVTGEYWGPNPDQWRFWWRSRQR